MSSFSVQKRLLSVQQAKALDIKSEEKFGLSVLVLMENAGRTVAEEIIKIIKPKKSIAIFCGRGNNGGDGFVAGRHLLARRIKPDIFLAGKIDEVKNEAKTNLEIILRLKQKVIEIDEKNLGLIKKRISRYDLIIDALLGIGLKGKVRGIYWDLIETINQTKVFVLSVDIPSGLDANNGKILGNCIKADKTVTFVAKKKGMVQGAGPKYCGKVVVKDLGIPLF